MPLPDFHVSEPFTLGIELEMQVVNPPGYDLSQDSSMLIDAVKNKITAGEVKHDITESMLELATDVCRDINQAAGQFSAMQKVVLQAATDHHLEICGGGTHPFQKWQRQEVCDNERYQRTLENFGYLIQQATVFGQHVHVGCASGDDAIYLLHGLSRFVPHFIALSAASPYMQGTDTRFASSRPNIFSAFPDNGPMPWVSNWQQFEALFRCFFFPPLVCAFFFSLGGFSPLFFLGGGGGGGGVPLFFPRRGGVGGGVVGAPPRGVGGGARFNPGRKVFLVIIFLLFRRRGGGWEGPPHGANGGRGGGRREDPRGWGKKIPPSENKFVAPGAVEPRLRRGARGLKKAQLKRDFGAGGGSLFGLVKKHCEIWAGD
ncbi:YbdK family carboxylate-amine ligase [Escherichia coli]|uniref:YbdK family carboxylate-amine ligase n=1 Tax=Escherichia coli TaxID=562 RepID=UPI003A86D793